MTARIRSAGWLVGAIVGVAAGSGAAVATESWQEAREAAGMEERRAVFGQREDVPGPVDTVQELLAQDSLVVVDPLLESRIPAEDREAAEEILASSPVPARIAYLQYPLGGGEIGYTTYGVGPQWWTSVGEEGHYVVLWDNGGTEAGAVGLEPEHVRTRTQGQPGPALVRLATEMATWEADPLPSRPDGPSDFDYWGGVSGGLLAAGLFGTFIVLPLFAGLRAFVGSRRRKAT